MRFGLFHCPAHKLCCHDSLGSRSLEEQENLKNAEKWLTVFQWSRESHVSGASQSVSQKRGRLGCRIRMESRNSGFDCRLSNKCCVGGDRDGLCAWGRKHCNRGDQRLISRERNNAPRCWKRLYFRLVFVRFTESFQLQRSAVTVLRNDWLSGTWTQIRQVWGHRRTLGLLMLLNGASLDLTVIKFAMQCEEVHERSQASVSASSVGQQENPNLTGIVSYFPKSSSEENF